MQLSRCSLTGAEIPEISTHCRIDAFLFLRYVVCLAVGDSRSREVAFQCMHGLAPSSGMSSTAVTSISAAIPKR